MDMYRGVLLLALSAVLSIVAITVGFLVSMGGR